MESAKIIDTDFSTADTGYPSFFLKKGLLVLQYKDMVDQSVTINFTDVHGIRWQEIESGPQERDDMTYEIFDSDWIAKYREQNMLPRKLLRHFKFCFNTSGTLEVLATEFHRAI